MSIILNRISKQFGNNTILNDISFTIGLGQCFWLVGRNGAGKSTMINILSDMIAPSAGVVTIGGLNYGDHELAIKRNLGVLPDKNPAIPHLTGYEYLRFVALLHEIPPDETKQRTESLLSFFFESEDEPYKRISTYSHGMLKKIALCAALVHRPQYLVLDEPFAGLDPVSNARLVQFLQSYLSPDRAIFLSSHDLGYAQKVITHLGILDDARLHFVGSVEEFTSASEQMDASILAVLRPAETDVQQLDWLLQ